MKVIIKDLFNLYYSSTYNKLQLYEFTRFKNGRQ